jgi:hypothetical protein
MKSLIKKPLAKGLVTTPEEFNFKSKIKQAIVGLACRSLISFDLADWLIQEGGLKYE